MAGILTARHAALSYSVLAADRSRCAELPESTFMEITATAVQNQAFEAGPWASRWWDLLTRCFAEAARSSAVDPARFTWISNPRGRCITCVKGELRLTVDGEPHDIVLQAGQSIVCEKDRPLLISAFQQATWHAR